MVKQCFSRNIGNKSPIYLFLPLGSSIFIYFVLITEGIRTEIKPTNSLGVCPPVPDRIGCL